MGLLAGGFATSHPTPDQGTAVASGAALSNRQSRLKRTKEAINKDLLEYV